MNSRLIHRSLTPALTLLALFGATPARAELLPPGAIIENAAIADITEQGCQTIGALAPAMIPTDIVIPDMSQSSSCDLWSWDFELGYSFTNAAVSISGAEADIIPSAGALHVEARFDVSLNDSSNPFYMSADICGISVDCSGYVIPFDATLTFDLGLQIVDDGKGGKKLDATVLNLDVAYTLDGSNIILEDCWIGDLEEILSYVGLSVYDLVLGFAGTYIEEAITGFATELEATIEDSFASTTIDQSLELGGATLDLHLYPSDLAITSNGVRVVMGGSMSTAEPAACIAAYDPGGSLLTLSNPPDIGQAPTGIDRFDLGIMASDEIANQALYALWRGGLLCYTIDDSFESFPINTSIFQLMNVTAFDELFPEDAPMAIITRPQQAPTVNWSGEHDAEIQVQKLGLDFIAEIDHRQARLMALDVQANAGANINLDGASGMLGIELDIGSDALTIGMEANEFAPEASDDIIANFGGLIDSLLPTLLGSLGSIDAIQLPGFGGIGLVDLQISEAGSQGDWLGAYASLGPVLYKSSGCGEETKKGSGCGGGCAGLGDHATRWAFLPLLGLLFLRRRR